MMLLSSTTSDFVVNGDCERVGGGVGGGGGDNDRIIIVDSWCCCFRRAIVLLLISSSPRTGDAARLVGADKDWRLSNIGRCAFGGGVEERPGIDRRAIESFANTERDCLNAGSDTGALCEDERASSADGISFISSTVMAAAAAAAATAATAAAVGCVAPAVVEELAAGDGDENRAATPMPCFCEGGVPTGRFV